MSRTGRKITPDDVETILHRLDSNEKPGIIAGDYGISRVMVWYIQTGEKWKLITKKEHTPFEGGFMEITVTYNPRIVSAQKLEEVNKLIEKAKEIGE